MNALKNYVLDLLSRREYTQRSLEKKLLSHAVPQDQIQTLLHWLVEQGFQDDARCADSYIRSRMHRGFGPLHIMAGLKRLGIDDHLIQDMVVVSDDQWSRLAQQVHKKKYPLGCGEKAKAIRFLLQRGFTHSHIQSLWGAQ